MELRLDYNVPAENWKKRKEDLIKEGYEPLFPELAHAYMKKLGEIFEKSNYNYYPFISYGFADVANNAIAQIVISEGFDDGTSYFFVISFYKDKVCISNDEFDLYEGKDINDVYEFFKDWLED